MGRSAAVVLGVSTGVGAVVVCASSFRTSTIAAGSGARQQALARARVWQAPAVPIAKANLALNPPAPAYLPNDVVRCRFEIKTVGGLTPKFPCITATGERLKVRYGAANREIPAELAASRLLSALGFPTDPVYAVAAVECEGCPSFPFLALRCFRNVHAESACMPLRDASALRRFTPVLLERRSRGDEIESYENQGWTWSELDMINPTIGSSRAEVDALRLMAVLLAHWDNKGENQRLFCPDESRKQDGTCSQPIAMIADLGATFGPLKAHLARWQSVPMWVDARNCEVSMESLPYRGGTFPRRRITEEGRRLAIRLLSQLSSQQLTTLFAGAGFANVPSWVGAFQHKVAQLRSAGPCPGE
jgi:hypothetical protein